MTYAAQVDGFSGSFETVAAIQAWLSDLDRRFGLKGCTLQVFKATWVARDGSGATYRGTPDLMKVLCKIETSYWAKPVPPRNFDWCAWFDGDEPNDDGSMLCGYGATEEAAIADLKQQVEE